MTGPESEMSQTLTTHKRHFPESLAAAAAPDLPPLYQTPSLSLYLRKGLAVAVAIATNKNNNTSSAQARRPACNTFI